MRYTITGSNLHTDEDFTLSHAIHIVSQIPVMNEDTLVGIIRNADRKLVGYPSTYCNRVKAMYNANDVERQVFEDMGRSVTYK